MHIRQETSGDYDAVYRLVKAAFASAQYSDGNEQNLVTALRKSDAFVPALSLVAELDDGTLAGHILFTEGRVGADTVLVLAPLSVLPSFQKQGIGMALIAEGHRIAAALGYTHALVLGSDTYYPRAGYLPAAQFGIEVPEGMPPEHFMVIRLRGDAGPICGAVTYAKEFGI